MSEFKRPFVFRIYADGRDFGANYATLKEAKKIKKYYSDYWPYVKYKIKAIKVNERVRTQ